MFRLLPILVAFLLLVTPATASAACKPLGMNLGVWFTQYWWPDWENPDPVTWASNMFVPAVDLTRLQNYKFDSVRIMFNPIYWAEEEGYPAMVYAGVDLFLNAGFKVTLGMNPMVDVKTTLWDDDELLTTFATLWTTIATELSSRSTALLTLELLSEPEYHGHAAEWYVHQQELHDAVRAAAPNHTILATGHGWSTAADLVLVTPIVDDNTVYSFHFYNPYAFTFQGEASWDELEGLPYPSTVANVATAVALIDPEPSQAQLDIATAYGAAEWDRDVIEPYFLSVYNWSVTNSVEILLDEYGVRHPEAPADSLVRWGADIRYLTTKYGFKASWWAYTGERGFMDGWHQDPYGRTVNSAVVSALSSINCRPTHTMGTFNSQ
jgi:hypothetical protein